MKITIQYFDGCPHWKLADEHVLTVLRARGRKDVLVEHQLIDSPELAARVGFQVHPRSSSTAAIHSPQARSRSE